MIRTLYCLKVLVAKAATSSKDYGLIVAVGGAGGIGGHGGYVRANNAATLTTYGSNAKGISIQSIGGGSGNGGDAYNFGALGGVAVGGMAGGGGNGDTAEVLNRGDILTSGIGSHAIMANSVGGGGGDGGSANGVTIGFGAAVQVSIGGSGGTGGSGGNVIVQQNSVPMVFCCSVDSTIRTGLVQGSDQLIAGVGLFAGDLANGILAQSIGGGGGYGGRALAVTASAANIPTISVAVGIGGTGGSGGDGGNVDTQIGLHGGQTILRADDWQTQSSASQSEAAAAVAAMQSQPLRRPAKSQAQSVLALAGKALSVATAEAPASKMPALLRLCPRCRTAC